MEGIATTIKNNENIIGYVLLGGVGLTVISCLERCDFNLFLFIFVFYTIYSSGHQAKVIPQIERTELMLTSAMFVFSIVIDLFWVCFYRNTVSGVVYVVNYIEIVLKVVIGLCLVITWLGGKKKEPLTSNSSYFGKLNEDNSAYP